jgi:hypothetical protein
LTFLTAADFYQSINELFKFFAAGKQIPMIFI